MAHVEEALVGMDEKAAKIIREHIDNLSTVVAKLWDMGLEQSGRMSQAERLLEEWLEWQDSSYPIEQALEVLRGEHPAQ